MPESHSSYSLGPRSSNHPTVIAQITQILGKPRPSSDNWVNHELIASISGVPEWRSHTLGLRGEEAVAVADFIQDARAFHLPARHFNIAERLLHHVNRHLMNLRILHLWTQQLQRER